MPSDNVSVYEVFQSPEFKAFCDRFGIDRSRPTLSMTIHLGDKGFSVTQEYIPEPERVVRRRAEDIKATPKSDATVPQGITLREIRDKIIKDGGTSTRVSSQTFTCACCHVQKWSKPTVFNFYEDDTYTKGYEVPVCESCLEESRDLPFEA